MPSGPRSTVFAGDRCRDIGVRHDTPGHAVPRSKPIGPGFLPSTQRADSQAQPLHGVSAQLNGKASL
jgi:hypothetical protein